VREKVQRGRILYLRPEAHRRIIPHEKAEKLGKRPFLVVQRDYSNSSSKYTVIVGVTTADKDSKRMARPNNKTAVDAVLPKGEGLVNEDSIADCGLLYTVADPEILNVFDGTYDEPVMKHVDAAIRLALDLDPDKILES
jgi:mRNA-degrading endonuclease toxin of MazEF toxin-antitoxin module